MIRKKYY